MSDPIAFVPYQPNRPIREEAADAARPAGGDPGAMMDAITTTVQSRAAFATLSERMRELSTAFRSEQFTGILQAAQEHQDRCSAAWSEYGRRRR